MPDRSAPTAHQYIDLADRSDPARAVGADLPCQHENPRLWFSDRPSDLNLARAHCRTCPERNPCLTGAIERAEPHGVWGGEIFDRGRVIEQKRPRGRPRRVPVNPVQALPAIF